ncbi:BTAD domain-containing putative transcriptional regulator [Streptomyces sp. NPDC006544]|uniref:AfsR/SARP family transcriptional regulator n=1 Tax=Streptomyces sp. NPDC006544 TaxID=3154583 RepID=UPI0033BDACAE
MLLEPGRVVPVARLVEAAWEDESPITASHQIRKAVADLRRRIPGGSDLIATDGPGYRAVLEDGQLDLSLFQLHTRLAREALAAGRSSDAETALRTALGLWRGPVLAGAGGPVVEAAATALEERRLTAAEQLYQLRLDHGESAELVGDLRELVDSHPLRETLRGHLMLALYRSGRQAEALEEFGRVRELLVEELGVDPGPRLGRLHEGILRDSPELAAPRAPDRPAPAAARASSPAPARAGAAGSTAPASGSGPAAPAPAAAASARKATGATGAGVTPCTLPYDLSDFSGRSRELGSLLAAAGSAHADGPDGADARTRIVAVDGMGGTGKTALAVRVAHQLAEQYPDGQLHVDLRGYTPGEQPLQPGSVIAGLLRTLGVPGERIPEDPAGRAALWRATLVGRRLLLLFDNACDAAQVHPLLPASPGCLVLVTSRARLVELDGAQWISIGVMSPEDSMALVTETLGRERTEREPGAARSLAALCGHLPLALRIATARLRNRSRWTVQHLVDRLGDETRLLDELSSGERSVAATLRLSYQAMDEEHRDAFRLLSLHPGTDIDLHAAAALLATDTRVAEDLLEDLLDMHLVQQHELGYYAFHDLVRSFAQSLRNTETAADDTAAVERLLDYFYAATEAACAALFPARSPYETGLRDTPATLPPLAGAEAATAWFDREAGAVAAALSLAETWGFLRHVVYTTRNLAFFLNMRTYMEQYRRVGEMAIAAARRLGDVQGLRISLTNQVVPLWKLGWLREGITLTEEALALARAEGERIGEGSCLEMLGLLHSSLGELSEGLRYQELAVEVHQETGDVQAALHLMCSVSTTYGSLGRPKDALGAAQRAVELAREVSSLDGEVAARNDLASALLALGRVSEAEECLVRALQFVDESRQPDNLAVTFALMAHVRHLLGEAGEARRCEEQAMELVRRRASPARQMKVERLVGTLRLDRGEHALALELFEGVHRRASAAEYRMEEARALAGIAQASAALGDGVRAGEYRRRSEALFDSMGVPQDARDPR